MRVEDSTETLSGRLISLVGIVYSLSLFIVYYESTNISNITNILLLLIKLVIIVEVHSKFNIDNKHILNSVTGLSIVTLTVALTFMLALSGSVELSFILHLVLCLIWICNIVLQDR